MATTSKSASLLSLPLSEEAWRINKRIAMYDAKPDTFTAKLPSPTGIVGMYRPPMLRSEDYGATIRRNLVFLDFPELSLETMDKRIRTYEDCGGRVPRFNTKRRKGIHGAIIPIVHKERSVSEASADDALARIDEYDKDREDVRKKRQERRYQCPDWTMSFTLNRTFRRHYDEWHVQDPRFACPLCDDRFRKRNTADNHVRAVHWEERPFECRECDARFKLKRRSDEHVKFVHRRVRPFPCDEYGKWFPRKPLLDVHVNAVHQGVKNFPCPQCAIAFARKATRDEHVRTQHTDEPDTFPCHHCAEDFSTKSGLEVHVQAVHLKLRRFPCTHCPHQSASNDDLKKHLRTTHGAGTFICENSGNRYLTRPALKKHLGQQAICGQNDRRGKLASKK